MLVSCDPKLILSMYLRPVLSIPNQIRPWWNSVSFEVDCIAAVVKASRHEIHGECSEAQISWHEAIAAAEIPSIQTNDMSFLDAPLVTLALYSKGSNTAKYWSTPTKIKKFSIKPQKFFIWPSEVQQKTGQKTGETRTRDFYERIWI